jgi:hypothetical protein
MLEWHKIQKAQDQLGVWTKKKKTREIINNFIPEVQECDPG